MRAVCRVEPPIEQLMHWRYTCTAVRHRVSDYEFDPGPNAAQFGDSNGVGTGCDYQLDAVSAGIEAGVEQCTCGYALTTVVWVGCSYSFEETLGVKELA